MNEPIKTTRWQLRLNKELENIIRLRASKNERSINKEIICMIKELLEKESKDQFGVKK